MSRPYSLDLRERVVASIEAGASRHEAAERFDVSASSAIRWMQRLVHCGTTAAKPMGGSTSPLDAYADWFFRLIAAHPDWTLDEIVLAMEKEGIPGKRSAVWRFFQRHKITVKKKSVRAAEQERADVVRARGNSSKPRARRFATCRNIRPTLIRSSPYSQRSKLFCARPQPDPFAPWCTESAPSCQPSVHRNVQTISGTHAMVQRDRNLL